MDVSRVAFKPHPYQRKMLALATAPGPGVALWAWMGLGKTAVTLHAIAQLIASGEAQRVLVVAPPQVAAHTWPAELRKWEQLHWLRWAPITLRNTIEKGPPRRATLDLEKSDLGGDEDIHIVSVTKFYELVRHYYRKWPYDTVVLDEADGFKDHTTKRFKALKAARPFIQKVISLTGTPATEGYHTLWAQLFALDRGERLDVSITRYRKHYFDTDYSGFKLILRPGAKAIIDKKIGDICFTLRSEDHLQLPDQIFTRLDVHLTKAQMKLYRAFEKDYITQAQEIIGKEGDAIVADTAAALASKLLQLANGTVYGNILDGKPRKTYPFHTHKMDTLDRLVEQENSPILIAYAFQADRTRLLDRFPNALTFTGPRDIDRWNSGTEKIAIIHPNSAVGLNLQIGGHVLVWYGLCWSYRAFLQTNARLHRQGQQHPVLIYQIVTHGTYDTRVLAAQAMKHDLHDSLMSTLRLAS